MATQVQTRETRTVVFVNGVQTFRIVVQCIDRGSLPDTHIFLKQIVDVDDPQQDVFVRIVELADFDSLNTDPDEPGYKPDRDSAIGSGKAYWRSASFTKDYTDIEIADAARQAISDRLNTLVGDFDDYDSKFKTAPTQDLYYPSANETTIAALKGAYDTAYENYETAETDLTDAQTALNTAEIELSDAETAVAEWSAFQEGLQNSETILSDTKYWFNDLVMNYAKPFITCVDEFTDDYTRRFGDFQQATRKITCDTWGANLTDGDIGSIVTVDGAGDTATLIAFDNNNKEMLVNPAEPIEDNPFDGTHPTVYISTRPGAFYHMSVGSTLVTSANAPNIRKLIGCRDVFSARRRQAEIEVSSATQGITTINALVLSLNSKITAKEALRTQAREDVTTAQENLSKAAADLQTAYGNLESAYTAVKTVCPNWSPDNPFPPLPASS